MKSLPVLLLALLLPAGAALAQTVLPSGAVAPAGTVAPSGTTITPGTVPGSQPLSTPGMRDGGSPRASRHDETAPGMSHRDKKRLRKMSKPRSNPDGTMKAIPK